MKDIETHEDVDLLVREFYKKATIDPVIGHFFTEVVQLDWDEHIPKITAFWESILLEANTYRGNPMIKHIELSRLSPLQKQHFDRWLELWGYTVVEHFNGPKAAEAIARARNIAYLMLHKIEAANAH